MKRAKFSKTDKLFADATEYLFIEWLVRRGIFSAFKANYRHRVRDGESFRDALRRRILRIICSDKCELKNFIDGAFIFSSTPEGLTFWCDQAVAWSRFCEDFQNRL